VLIYVNQFKFSNIKDIDSIFYTISGWLKKITNQHFTVSDLKSGKEFSINQMMVRTYTAIDYSPKMYSILLTHPDKKVQGRQWNTEIGIKVEDSAVILSILLETRDISTQVKEVPSTTRPLLVTFLQQNELLSYETVGLNVYHFKNSQNYFKALSYEIERKERTCPLILISNTKKDNHPLIDPNKLQEQLLGLAQVVHSTEEINSWDLEKILTRQYSAWDGAINIIYPSFGKSFCYNKLFLKEKITDFSKSEKNFFYEILSLITHKTNGINKKLHFSPSDVRAKRQRDNRIKLKEQFFKESKNRDDDQKIIEDALEQLEKQEAEIDKIKQNHEDDMDVLYSENMELEAKLEKTYNELNKFKNLYNSQKNISNQGNPILVYGAEKENYQGEILDTILAIITQYHSNISENREKDVLYDILKFNKLNGTKKSYIEKLKKLFKNYNGITPKIKAELKKMNLEVHEDGNHNHLRFIGDSRYQVVFAKTPSDKRVGKNIIRDINKELL